MKDLELQLEKLKQEKEELQRRLEEVQATFDAIQSGEVDALVVDGPKGEQIYTLKGVNHTYRVIIENMQSGAITLANDGSILYANKFIEKVLDIPLEKCTGSTIDQYVHPSDMDILKAALKQAQKGQAAAELEFVTSNGATVPVYLSANCITIEDLTIYCLAVTDLTNQKRHEHILAEERLSRSIIDQAADAIIVCNEKGKVIRASRIAFDLAGHNCLHESFDRSFKLFVTSSEQLVSDNAITPEPFSLKSVIDGKRYHSCKATIKKSDETNKHLLLNAAPLSDVSGKVVGCIVNLTDITEKTKLENDLIDLNRELEDRVAQRTVDLKSTVEELESFAYSISHDLRSPLRALDGFSLALLEDYQTKLNPEGRDHLNRIRQASQKMGRLIDDLLRLSRVTRSEMKLNTIDLTSTVQGIAQRLQSEEPHRTVEFVIQSDLSHIGDFNLIEVLLNNLLGNAWKFTSKQPDAIIEFGVTEKSHGEDTRVFFVKDNGAGFDPQYKDRIFEAFQRLHGPKEFPGSGIGLATVQRVVRRHGGRVWAESILGEGATFYFTLGV